MKYPPDPACLYKVNPHIPVEITFLLAFHLSPDMLLTAQSSYTHIHFHAKRIASRL